MYYRVKEHNWQTSNATARSNFEKQAFPTFKVLYMYGARPQRDPKLFLKFFFELSTLWQRAFRSKTKFSPVQSWQESLLVRFRLPDPVLVKRSVPEARPYSRKDRSAESISAPSALSSRPTSGSPNGDAWSGLRSPTIVLLALRPRKWLAILLGLLGMDHQEDQRIAKGSPDSTPFFMERDRRTNTFFLYLYYDRNVLSIYILQHRHTCTQRWRTQPGSYTHTHTIDQTTLV